MEIINPEIYKKYDIRGLYPEHVNQESITPVINACGQIFTTGKIVVARDGRHGSEELANHAAKLFHSFKKDFTVVNVGLATTPMFYFLVNGLAASGGIMVTASHKPKSYNGLKIVGPCAVMMSGSEIKEFIVSQSN